MAGRSFLGVKANTPGRPGFVWRIADNKVKAPPAMAGLQGPDVLLQNPDSVTQMVMGHILSGKPRQLGLHLDAHHAAVGISPRQM